MHMLQPHFQQQPHMQVQLQPSPSPCMHMVVPNGVASTAIYSQAVLPALPLPAPTPSLAAVPMSSGRWLAARAQTQDGSKQLQDELQRMSPAKLQEACDELGPHIGTLATHTFGNYLVSSLCALPQAQPAIAAALTGRIIELASHVQGSRVVQAAISFLPIVTAGALVSELAGSVAHVARQTCGSWTICAAYKTTHAEFILAEVAAAIGTLSTLQDGSRVVQRVIPEAVSCGADLSAVLESLLSLGDHHLCRLAEDAYGNYVVQQALHHSDSPRRAMLIELLLPRLASLSISKAGSNAAESILGHVSAARLPEAHRLLVTDSPLDLSTHRFGKHVHLALFKRAAALSMRLG